MKRATLLALTVSACLLTGCTNALKDGTGYLEDGNYKEASTTWMMISAYFASSSVLLNASTR